VCGVVNMYMSRSQQSGLGFNRPRTVPHNRRRAGKSLRRSQTSSGQRNNAASRARQNPGLLPYLDKRVTGLSSFAARPMEQPVECEFCYEMVNLRNMDQHRLTVCPGRFVTCRILGCDMVFRAWDRDNHEKNFCQGTKRVKKVVKKTPKYLQSIQEKKGRTESTGEKD